MKYIARLVMIGAAAYFLYVSGAVWAGWYMLSGSNATDHAFLVATCTKAGYAETATCVEFHNDERSN